MINTFLNLEKNNNLFEKKIHNVTFWPFIRFQLYREIISGEENLGQMHSNESRSVFQKILTKLKQLPDYFAMHPLKRLEQKDVLIFNHSRRVKNGLFYECMYTDDIASEIPYSYYVMEKPYMKRHFRPVRTQNLRYLENIRFINVFKKFKKIKYRLNQEDRELIEQLINSCNKSFNINLKVEDWTNKVEDIIFEYYNRYDAYEHILEKVSPRAIVQVVSYSFENILINQIAHTKDVPVIELQHGMLGGYFPYIYDSKMTYPHFPKYIFCYGDYWREASRLPIGDDNVIATGQPYFEKRLKQLKDEVYNEQDTRKTILFLSQGPTGQKLSEIASTLSQRIDTERYRIIYKLHPGEYSRWRTEYPDLLTAELEVIDHNERDLFYYMQNSYAQIGVNSVALFEGLQFGLKTFVYKQYGHHLVRSIYEQGYGSLFSDVEELHYGIEHIQHQIPKSDYFWTKNSLNRIIAEIKKIIEV